MVGGRADARIALAAWITGALVLAPDRADAAGIALSQGALRGGVNLMAFWSDDGFDVGAFEAAVATLATALAAASDGPVALGLAGCGVSSGGERAGGGRTASDERTASDGTASDTETDVIGSTNPTDTGSDETGSDETGSDQTGSGADRDAYIDAVLATGGSLDEQVSESSARCLAGALVDGVGIDELEANDVSPETPHPYSGGRQTTWLDRELGRLRADPTIDFLVVWFHHCAFSTITSHGSDGGVRRQWVPLFDRHGVDLVINGHVVARGRLVALDDNFAIQLTETPDLRSAA